MRSEDEIRAEIDRLYSERRNALEDGPTKMLYMISLEGRIAALLWALGEQNSTVWDN